MPTDWAAKAAEQRRKMTEQRGQDRLGVIPRRNPSNLGSRPPRENTYSGRDIDHYRKLSLSYPNNRAISKQAENERQWEKQGMHIPDAGLKTDTSIEETLFAASGIPSMVRLAGMGVKAGTKALSGGWTKVPPVPRKVLPPLDYSKGTKLGHELDVLMRKTPEEIKEMRKLSQQSSKKLEDLTAKEWAIGETKALRGLSKEIKKLKDGLTAGNKGSFGTNEKSIAKLEKELARRLAAKREKKRPGYVEGRRDFDKSLGLATSREVRTQKLHESFDTHGMIDKSALAFGEVIERGILMPNRIAGLFGGSSRADLGATAKEGHLFFKSMGETGNKLKDLNREAMKKLLKKRMNIEKLGPYHPHNPPRRLPPDTLNRPPFTPF